MTTNFRRLLHFESYKFLFFVIYNYWSKYDFIYLNFVNFKFSKLLLLLLLQATYLRATKVNHIGESEARFSRS